MSSIASGQLSTDSVTISREQQRQCIKWYFDVQYRDSIIAQKDTALQINAARIETLERQYSESLDTVDRQSETVGRLRRSRLWGWLTAAGCAVVAALAIII